VERKKGKWGLSMADIELVIKIPEHCLEELRHIELNKSNEGVAFHAIKCIVNGTPLPKGHGRLGDLDAVMNDICSGINAMTNIGIAVDGEYLWGKLNDAIDNAPTIIDKGD
jgi:hypothetical protein